MMSLNNCSTIGQAKKRI